MKRFLTVMLLGAFVLAAGCSMTNKATEFNGVTDLEGDEVVHQSTKNVAIHLLFKKPLVYDASLQKTVDDFTQVAKENGASRVRIVQSQKSTYWWVLPPFSFVVHPVVTNVAGDVK